MGLVMKSKIFEISIRGVVISVMLISMAIVLCMRLCQKFGVKLKKY